MKELGKTLTIIPAKGTSSRIKKKNLSLLAGKPLLAYTIETALKSRCCGEIIVSTEDREIAEQAKKLGASVPFLRPEYLSHDPYEVDDVCFDVLKQYENIGKFFDSLIILLPTSPLRSVYDIKACVKIFEENDGEFLMSVSKMDPHLFDALEFDSSGINLSKLFPEMLNRPLKDRPQTVRCNGAVHILDVTAFKKTGSYYSEPLLGYEMPWERSIDIDTQQDLMLAEWLIEKGFVNSLKPEISKR